MTRARWSVDRAHSSLDFWVRHMMVAKVRGRFARWQAFVDFDEDAPSSSSVDVTIEAASIETWDDARDEHLRSADFLDVERYPAIAFRSTSVEPAGEGRYRMLGELTICGRTCPALVDVEYAGRVKDPAGHERVGFSASTAIQRKDFGLTWNQVLEAGGVLISDRIEITIEIEAIRQPAG
jgi:polyisoprenoid-binding protein YceI